MASMYALGREARLYQLLPLTFQVIQTTPCRYSALTLKVPGYGTSTTNNLRLWGSKAASGEFDFQKFNSGDYESSVADQQRAETISAVLYPNDKYASNIGSILY